MESCSKKLSAMLGFSSYGKTVNHICIVHVLDFYLFMSQFGPEKWDRRAINLIQFQKQGIKMHN